MTSALRRAVLRVSVARPCLICGGHPMMPRGHGRRCWGYLDADERYAHCTREEFSGGLERGRDDAFAHRLAGECRCGRAHSLVRGPVAAGPLETGGEERGAAARRLWSSALSASESAAEAYLRSRGISIQLPPSLRFDPRLPHGPTRRCLPAMVAAVTHVEQPGQVVAIHRTYLDPDGVGRALVEPNKMMLGPCGGGAVQLAPAAGVMAVTEGIETGLSVQQATLISTWAALSAVGLERLQLPKLPSAVSVVVAADRDRRGLEAARIAAGRWAAEGRRVAIVLPPAPFNDFNDLLRAAAL